MVDHQNFKVVLLGEGCVGKTSLVLRYVHNQFVDKHVTTVQASFLTKKLTVDGVRVNLAIWVRLRGKRNVFEENKLTKKNTK